MSSIVPMRAHDRPPALFCWNRSGGCDGLFSESLQALKPDDAHQTASETNRQIIGVQGREVKHVPQEGDV
jgi:hypothetical protein